MQSEKRQAFLFDLDGTLVDSVYQHVLAWREALEAGGIHLAVWRIHRQIGMSGGLFVNALLRETGRHRFERSGGTTSADTRRSVPSLCATGSTASRRGGAFVVSNKGRCAVGHRNEWPP